MAVWFRLVEARSGSATCACNWSPTEIAFSCADFMRCQSGHRRIRRTHFGYGLAARVRQHAAIAYLAACLRIERRLVQNQLRGLARFHALHPLLIDH